MRGGSSKEAFANTLHEQCLIKTDVGETNLEDLPQKTTFYKRFLRLYSVWLDVKALQLMFCENTIMRSLQNTGQELEMGTDSRRRIDDLQRPWPLRLLCSACFGSDPQPEIAMVCFDGNFQQRRFNSARQRPNPKREFRDRRLFIDSEAQGEQDLEASFTEK